MSSCSIERRSKAAVDAGTGGTRVAPTEAPDCRPKTAKKLELLASGWIPLTGCVLASLLALGAVGYSQDHAAAEERHRRFYAAGKSINGLLAAYCDALRSAHLRGDFTELAAFHDAAYRAPDRDLWSWRPHPSGPQPAVGLEIWEKRARGAGRPAMSSRTELPQLLADDLSAFGRIDAAQCKIDRIEHLEVGAGAQLTVKMVLDGVLSDGRRVQERHLRRWWLSATHGAAEGSGWRVVGHDEVEAFRVAGRGDALVPVEGGEVGVDFAHQRIPKLDRRRFRHQLAFGVMGHAGGGLSVADYDGDSRADLLWPDGHETRLYRNLGTVDGLPRFADVTEAAGLAAIDAAHCGLFADFDNDGDRDLFVGRYLEPNLFYENLGDGTFREVGRAMGVDATLPTMAATLLDYDRDGFLDLYLAVYGNAFEAVPRLPFFARNGEANRLYRNDRGRGFVDVTRASRTGDTGWSLAVAAGDVDGDGWPDLAVANDFGRKSLYRNNGDGTFSETAKDAGVLDFGFGMGLAFADLDDDGDADLYTSNVSSNQRWFGEDLTVRQYLRNFARTRWAFLDAGELFDLYRLLGPDWSRLFLQVGAGSSLFLNRGDGSFDEQPDGQTHRTGWGWGVAFFDLENDADLDLYAANGWISNTPGTDL